MYQEEKMKKITGGQRSTKNLEKKTPTDRAITLITVIRWALGIAFLAWYVIH